MYLRPHSRSKDGKSHAYWSLVETVRTPDGPRQRTICYLGELNSSAHARWQKTVEVFNEQGDSHQLSPAGDLIHIATVVEMMKSCVGIGLQCTFEVLQMQSRMFTLAIRRVSEPDGWRGVFAGRSFIANISPEAASLRLSVAWSEHRNRRIVGMNLACG